MIERLKLCKNRMHSSVFFFPHKLPCSLCLIIMMWKQTDGVGSLSTVCHPPSFTPLLPHVLCLLTSPIHSLSRSPSTCAAHKYFLSFLLFSITVIVNMCPQICPVPSVLSLPTLSILQLSGVMAPTLTEAFIKCQLYTRDHTVEGENTMISDPRRSKCFLALSSCKAVCLLQDMTIWGFHYQEQDNLTTMHVILSLQGDTTQ